MGWGSQPLRIQLVTAHGVCLLLIEALGFTPSIYKTTLLKENTSIVFDREVRVNRSTQPTTGYGIRSVPITIYGYY